MSAEETLNMDDADFVERAKRLKAPHFFLAMAEPGRAFLEASTLPWGLAALTRVPSGDGHPVLVIPGFTASDLSTVPLRRFLEQKNYAVHPWRMGRNIGTFREFIPKLERRVIDLAEEYGEKVSLVGQSLGGIYAREVARECPDLVRQVITLGSPFGGAAQACNVVWAYDAVTGERIRLRPSSFFELMAEPPPVPSTAIFSKTDGIASWQTCMEPASDWTDNVEILGSHCGMGFNPVVLFAIADRLAQPEAEWSPFDKGGWRRAFYR